MNSDYKKADYDPGSVHHPELEDYSADKYGQLFIQMRQDAGTILKLGEPSTDMSGSKFANAE